MMHKPRTSDQEGAWPAVHTLRLGEVVESDALCFFFPVKIGWRIRKLLVRIRKSGKCVEQEGRRRETYHAGPSTEVGVLGRDEGLPFSRHAASDLVSLETCSRF